MAGVLHSNIYSGMIICTPENQIPTGWLSCDGTFKSCSTYADLFGAVGHTYNGGVDPGNGTFKLPDLNSSRIPIGASNTSAAGTTGGSNTHTHNFTSSVTATPAASSGNHYHNVSGSFATSSDGGHNHSFTAANIGTNATGSVVNTAKILSGGLPTATGSHSHTTALVSPNGGEGGHSHSSSAVTGVVTSGAHSHNANTSNSSIIPIEASDPLLYYSVLYLIKT
jgi:microcystin-dependent protein